MHHRKRRRQFGDAMLRRAAHRTVIVIRDALQKRRRFSSRQVTRRCGTLSTKRRTTLKSYNQTGEVEVKTERPSQPQA
jgi:hypothetical protein